MHLIRRSGRTAAVASVMLLLLLAGGCVLSPKGTEAQKKQLEAAGKPYEKPFEQRHLPDLPQPASWQDVLQRAFLANGDLEAAYHEWRAASERITMSSYWPNSNLQLGFDYMFTRQSMKTWDRITTSASVDPSMALRLPSKVAKGGEIALANAMQSAATFRGQKFRLQKQVLSAYYDLALMQEQIRIEQENLRLLGLLVESAASRVKAGGPQQDLIKAQVAQRLSENSLASMQSQARTMRAMLNGMLARSPEAPLELPAELPPPRNVQLSDDRLIAMGVDASPEIARLASQVQGRKDAIELARMQYLPDISPAASITGSLSQSIGAMVMLPTTIPMINAAIRESKAMRDASDAMLRQARADRAGQYVGTIYALRNAQRQQEFFEKIILPAARQVFSTSRQDYASGRVGLIELIDAQRTLLDVRESLAQFRMDREKRLAEIEELTGLDLETLAEPAPTTAPAESTQPSTRAATQPFRSSATTVPGVSKEGAMR